MELKKDMDSEVACHHCNKMLETPIELPCTHHACAACVKDRLLTSNSLVSPHCNAEHPLEFSSVFAPSTLLLQLLGKVQVRCTLCGRGLLAEAAERHIKSKCTAHTITSLSLNTIKKQPVNTPLSAEEKEISNFVDRRLVAGSTKPVSIATGCLV
jgi:phage FluMu protein Com